MADKTYKAISHIERMSSPKYKCNCAKSCVSHEPLYHVETQSLDEKSHRIVTGGKLAKKPSLKMYNVNDFSLENLQALGVPLSSVSLQHDMNTSLNMAESSALLIDDSINKSKTE